MVKGAAGGGRGSAPVAVLVEQFKGLGGLGDLLLAHAFEGDALRARGHG